MDHNWNRAPQIIGKPNFDNLLAILRKEKPERPTLFEFFLNDRLHKRLAPITESEKEKPFALQRQVMWAYHNAGYDHANILIPDFHFPSNRIHGTATISINEGGLIKDWKSFESYLWPDPDLIDYSILDVLASELPNGMKLIPYGPNGVLENVIELVGYEALCYMIADEPELVSKIFEKVGAILVKYYQIVSAHPSVGACISNDDWGFKTQTLLSPRQMRTYLFPWHKRIVDVVHQTGKPVILHSCGHFERIIDDLSDLGIDGRHSYEDTILPVEQAYERYRDRFAVIGGLDVDFLCRSTPEEVYTRAKAMLTKTAHFGGYALGSGNSIPDYVPDENFFAMIHAALECR
jgi:uroporphyrinogen decarboxylase